MPERMDFEAERFLTSPSQSVHTCVHTHTSTESFCCGCFYLFNYYFIFIIPQIFIECLLYPSTLLDSSRHSNEKPQKFLPLWSLYPSRNVPLSFLLEMGSKRGDFLGIPVGKTPHSQWRGLGFNPWSGNLRSCMPLGAAKKDNGIWKRS